MNSIRRAALDRWVYPCSSNKCPISSFYLLVDMQCQKSYYSDVNTSEGKRDGGTERGRTYMIRGDAVLALNIGFVFGIVWSTRHIFGLCRHPAGIFAMVFI